MKYFICIFIATIFLVSSLLGQGPSRPVYPSELDSVSLNTPGNPTYGEVLEALAYTDSVAWSQYVAGWHSRLVTYRGMFQGLGMDSLKADSLARLALKDHNLAESLFKNYFANMRSELINLNWQMSDIQNNTAQNSDDIETLANGVLAHHAKGVKDRGNKKKKSLQEISEIVNRRLRARNK